MPLAEALPAIHSPQDAEQLERARRRFVFQELFILQLAVVARRWQQQVGFRAPPLVATPDINARIERLFPFELTAGQRAAIREVAADMASETPMNRLLQGDVGSGKTVVAVYAMLACVARGSSGRPDGANGNPGPPTCRNARRPAAGQPRAARCCSSAA